MFFIYFFLISDGNHEEERLLFKYSRIIYVNLLCQYFCQGLRTRGCVETEAGLCLFENAKQVFKTVGLSKCDTDNEGCKTSNNNDINNNNNKIMKITIIMKTVIIRRCLTAHLCRLTIKNNTGLNHFFLCICIHISAHLIVQFYQF